MSWKPGESGNPEGNRNYRRFLATLERAILADDGKRLRAAIEKLLDLAADGEAWAIKEIADRLDGRPPQALLAQDAEGRHIAIALVAYNPAQLSAPALPAPSLEGDGLRH